MKRLPLKYLTVNWLHHAGPRNCFAIQFLVTLLRIKLGELKFLKIDGVPEYSLKSINDDWTPWVPKLRILHVDFPESFEEIYGKLVKAAPTATTINRLS